MLEGRLKEKEMVMDELAQQMEEMDFMASNTKAEFDLYIEDSERKESQKNRLIN